MVLIAAPPTDLHLIQVILARFSTEYAPIWNQQFATSTIAGLLPLIFIYMFQKQFVSELTGIEHKQYLLIIKIKQQFFLM